MRGLGPPRNDPFDQPSAHRSGQELIVSKHPNAGMARVAEEDLVPAGPADHDLDVPPRELAQLIDQDRGGLAVRLVVVHEELRQELDRGARPENQVAMPGTQLVCDAAGIV